MFGGSVPLRGTAEMAVVSGAGASVVGAENSGGGSSGEISKPAATSSATGCTTSGGGNVGGAAGLAKVPATAEDWTLARKGLDGELALLYLLDIGEFRTLVLRHQLHLGQVKQGMCTLRLVS